MGSAPRHYKRRNFFIKKGLQARFIVAFSLAVAAGLILNLLLAYYLIDKGLTEEIYKVHLKIKTTTDIAGPILWKLGAVTTPVVLAIAAFAGYHLTRRVEIPLLTFREAVGATTLGDLTKRLRRDPHTDIPEYFNLMNRRLSHPFRSLRHSMHVIEAEIDGMADSVKGNRQGLAESLARFSEARKAVGNELSKFKI